MASSNTGFAGPLSGAGTTTIVAPVHLRVDYGTENPIAATVQTQPDDHRIQGHVRVTVTRKRGRIELREVSADGVDLTKRPDVAKGKTYTRGTLEESVNYLFDNKTLAAFIHANVELTVLDADGGDVTGQYKAKRFMRVWSAPLEALAAGQSPQDGDGSVSGRAGHLVLKHPWNDDGTGWVDVPGSIGQELVGAFPTSRQIQEFLWSAKNHSDIITPIYYLVVTDTRPSHRYRIRVYQPHNLTIKQYREIRSSSRPWQNEGDTAIFDSHWVDKDVITLP